MAVRNSTTIGEISFELENVQAIREALHIGLESFGELERLTDVCGLYRRTGMKIPDDMRPIHPTGSNSTIGVFATALRALETFDPVR